MVLAIVGILMVLIIVGALMKSKANPIPLFVLVPIVAAALCGFGFTEISAFVKAGVGKTWSVAVLFIFSIVYFSIMSDVGLFDPLVNFLVKIAGSNVILVTVATACIATVSHLDGALASTLLITVPAMLPVYKKLNIRPVVLVCIIGAAMSIMNLLPWGGPVARTGVILNADINQLWKELIPLQIAGLVVVLAFAAFLGYLEKKRGAGAQLDSVHSEEELTKEELAKQAAADALKRPKLLWFNGLLTLTVIGLLCFTKIPLYAAFMFGLALALLVNFPNAKDQAARIKAHAADALSVPMILLASGVFLGVLSGSKMMDNMATLLIGLIPDMLGPYLNVILGALAVPIGMLLGTDSYFFGLVPLAIGVGQKFGIDPHNMALTMLIGKNYGVLVTPHAATTFLACGLAGIELKELLSYCTPRLLVLSWVSLAIAFVLGIIYI